MHSVLGRGFFSTNSSISDEWKRSAGGTIETLLSLQLVWIAGWTIYHCLLFSWKYPMDSLTIKHSNTMVIEPAFGTFGSVGR